MRRFIVLILTLCLIISACPKKEPQPEVRKVIGCETTCPAGYECDETENRCIPLPHSFSCIDSCPSDKY
ncbi:MAG: hypothetical protein N3B13_12225, partial [Deltaproteobacteria bacterium]|nr:hypothetical protein [Deltaproteobacteria bacterium]